MRTALSLAVLLAACSEPPGTHVVVHDPLGTAVRVAMYIGVEKTDAYTEIRAQDADVLPGDVLWLEEDPPPSIVTVEEGRAVFALRPRPGDTETSVAMIALVGYDADEQIVGLATLHPTRPIRDESMAIVVDLEPAQAALPSRDPAEPARVYTWGASEASCIGLETGREVSRTWLVPESDPDCDGLANECRADEWEQDAPTEIASNLEERECFDVVKGSQATGDRACRVGAYFGCEPEGPDDAQSDTACTGFQGPRYCVPARSCDYPPPVPGECLENPRLCVGEPNTRVVCEFVTNQEGEPCVDDTPAYLYLGTTGTTPTGIAGCTGARIGPRVAAFDREGVFDAGGSMNTVRVRIENDVSMSDCKYKLTFVSGVLPFLSLAVGVGLVDFELTNERHLVLPIVFQRHVGTCTGNSVCRLELAAEDTTGIPTCLE